MKTPYEERVPIVEAALRRLGRAATVAELYDELEACDSYDAMACRIDGYGVLLEGGAL